MKKMFMHWNRFIQAISINNDTRYNKCGLCMVVVRYLSAVFLTACAQLNNNWGCTFRCRPPSFVLCTWLNGWLGDNFLKNVVINLNTNKLYRLRKESLHSPHAASTISEWTIWSILTIIKKFNRKLCNMDDVCLLQLVFLYIQIVLEHTID